MVFFLKKSNGKFYYRYELNPGERELVARLKTMPPGTWPDPEDVIHELRPAEASALFTFTNDCGTIPFLEKFLLKREVEYLARPWFREVVIISMFQYWVSVYAQHYSEWIKYHFMPRFVARTNTRWSLRDNVEIASDHPIIICMALNRFFSFFHFFFFFFTFFDTIKKIYSVRRSQANFFYTTNSCGLL
jgi:hypothetical protein